MKMGVLALQGAFYEHVQILQRLGVQAVTVRLPEDLKGLQGLIIPGGESTTIGKMAERYGLLEPLRRFGAKKPMWGTCAGMILMAKEVGAGRPLLKLMDIRVERNAYGRQLDSFESPVKATVFQETGAHSFPGIFIRAPRLVEVRKDARVIAVLPDGAAVGALQGRLLATSFHPELTADDRFHRYFLRLAGL